VDLFQLETFLTVAREGSFSRAAKKLYRTQPAISQTVRKLEDEIGEPLFDRLDADIAWAMMGINAVKGVEIGAGFASVAQRGTTHGDSPTPRGFRTNNAGGVLGGISTGQDLEVSIAVKPTSSILSPRETIDVRGEPTQVVTKGRHDPCVGIRAAPIAEAMLALVVMEHALRQRAQNADVVSPVKAIPGSLR